MISCRDITLVDANSGESFVMSRMGVWVEDVIIPSAEVEHETEGAEGLDGLVRIDTRLGSREITAIMQYEVPLGISPYDFRRRIYQVFDPHRDYYLTVREDRGIRYPCRVASAVEYEELTDEDGRIEVTFLMFRPFAETALPTSRVFTQPSFVFMNPGTAQINPLWQSDTEITFSGSSTGLEILNKTTGDLWAYNGSTVSGDTLMLKGVRSLKNGTSVFRETNKRLLTFAPGRNEIEIRGAGEGFELSIHTRFYYR